MYILNIEAQGGVILDSRTRKFHRFIGGIVEHLNLKLIARVIDRGHRLRSRSTTYISLKSGSCTVMRGNSLSEYLLLGLGPSLCNAKSL